jgi:putative membrane protein
VPVAWGGWSIEPPLAYVALAGLLYWMGARKAPALAGDRRRELAFAAGLVSIVLALDSPLDGDSEKLFWVHMLQHVVLLTVSPPLILLGRPWPRMWRALPLSTRTRAGRAIALSRTGAPLRKLARPWPAFALFNGTLLVWHIPALYDATLRSGALHQLEHAMFFFTGLVFWAHVVDAGPLRPRLTWVWRIAYLAGAMIAGFALALTLAMASHPIYGHYAALISRPGGISALADQQLAAGMMWVPGSISYSIGIFIAFYRWLAPERGPVSIPAVPTS